LKQQKVADSFQLLGVRRNAPLDVIKKAYRKRALELHPDTSPLPDSSDRFKDLQRAYDDCITHRGQRPQQRRDPRRRHYSPDNPLQDLAKFEWLTKPGAIMSSMTKFKVSVYPSR
jgi:hypothetical protein